MSGEAAIETGKGETLDGIAEAVSAISGISGEEISDDEAFETMLNLGRSEEHQLYSSYMEKSLTLRGDTVIRGIRKMYESFEEMMTKRYPEQSEEIIKKGFATCILGAKNLIVGEKVKETEQRSSRSGNALDRGQKGDGRDDE